MYDFAFDIKGRSRELKHLDLAIVGVSDNVHARATIGGSRMSDVSFNGSEDKRLGREAPPREAGFIKFYGLYWKKSAVVWQDKKLLGQPQGWMGKGNIAKNFDRSTVQMNFWNQKGVYILYDDNLHPVYAGQAGLTRKNAAGGQCVGDRLWAHSRGVYRNGWSLFSWFGFLSMQKINLKEADDSTRMEPSWQFNAQSDSELNQLLASFEAILIEGFAPRFNARGGDLGKAVLVDQYEEPAAQG